MTIFLNKIGGMKEKDVCCLGCVCTITTGTKEKPLEQSNSNTYVDEKKKVAFCYALLLFHTPRIKLAWDIKCV